MEENRQGIGPWANLPSSKDPASPHYLYHPEHERLSSITPSAITTPSITPALPSFIAYWTGMYNMYGVRGRDSVYTVAMRGRAELIPRPFTQVEHAVMARYMQNLQNGAEYFGFLGLVGGAYWGTRTEFWPMEKSFRTILGLKGGANGPEPFPPSGLVYPNGWGQKQGEGNVGNKSSTAGSTPSAAPAPPESANDVAKSANDAAKPANDAAKPVNDTAKSANDAAKPPKSAVRKFNFSAVTAEYLRSPNVTPPKPTYRYDFISNWYRSLYMYEPPPEFMIRFTMWAKRQVDAVPPEKRDTGSYKTKVQRYESAVKRVERLKLVWQAIRSVARGEMTEQLDKLKKAAEAKGTGFGENIKELEALMKEFDDFDKRWAEASANRKHSLTDVMRNAENITGSTAEATASEAVKPTKPNDAPHPRLASAYNSNQTGAEFRSATSIYMNAIKNAIRVSTWAFFGKYVVGTLGLMWLTSGSRGKEMADERLQEYNYDRIEYAKSRIREAGARRGIPVPPQQPQREPNRGDNGDGEVRQPDRFEPMDTQSLGGVQNENIDWGDLVKDDPPAVAREKGNDAALPPFRPGESAWDRARRAREGPQGPAMEEDRWAPQVQQDTAAKTNDMASVSRWERIRQQASEGYANEKRVPGESRDGGEGGSSFAGFGKKQGQDRQKTREELQREFDAQLEKERKVDDGAWK